MKKEMWDTYFEELTGGETLRSEDGFCSFKDYPETSSLFIHHFYIKAEKRGGEAVKVLVGQIKDLARERGRKLLTASCDQEENKVWQMSLKAQLNAGFKISAVSGTVVYTYLSI